MNRAQMREDARVLLGIGTPLMRKERGIAGYENAKPGDHPSWDPTLQNSHINLAIRNAAAITNTEAGVIVPIRNIEIAIPESTNYGRDSYDLDTLTTLGSGTINSVIGARWDDGERQMELDPVDVADTRYRHGYRPGRPLHFAVSGRMLWLIPAPQIGGTLQLDIAGGGALIAPLTDAETVRNLPSDMMTWFEFIVVMQVAAICFDDARIQERAKPYVPQALQAIGKIRQYLRNLNGVQGEFAKMETYRPRRHQVWGRIAV